MKDSKTPKATKVKDFQKVSQSTKVVSFKWSNGNSEKMSENVAEILELKGLGKKEN